MAYRFVEKRKTVQEEMAYIVYMIVGSYFNKAVCINHGTASRLYLYYMEMKENSQISKEQKIIMQSENVLKEYKSILCDMNCEVYISFKENKFVLDFITGFERIHAEVDKKGNCELCVIDTCFINRRSD